MGFIGENLLRANVLTYSIFSLFHKFVFYGGVSMGIRSGSIRLKELQVVSEALRKEDEGL